LARQDQKVLLLDLDPLENSVLSFSVPPAVAWQGYPLYQDVEPGLDIVLCGDQHLPDSAFWAAAQRYNFVLLDTGAALSPALSPLFARVDDLWVLVQDDPLCFRTLPVFLERLLQMQIQPHQLRGLLLNCIEPNAVSQQVQTLLRAQFHAYLEEVTIPFAPEAEQALLLGRPLMALQGREAPLPQAFARLAERLLQPVGRHA